MKKTYLIFTLFLISATLSALEQQKGNSTLKALITEIQSKYVPDKRVDIFEIEVAGTKGKPILQGATTNVAAHEELISLAKKSYPTLIDSIAILPSAELNGLEYGIVNVSVADMRVKNDFEHEMATQSILGTPIRVLQKRGGWYRVQTPDGYIAWMHNMSFSPMSKPNFNEWTASSKIIFTDYFGLAYQTPDRKGRTVSDLVNGNMLKYLGEEGAFYKVAYPDSRVGYVLKEQSQPFDEWLSSARLTEDNIIEKSFALLGIPYTWGGTSAKGMDCSGYTKSVLFMQGIIITRDASQQAYTGTQIDIGNGYENLRRGDLLFFGKRGENGKKDRIRHVGFYLGNNEFIHASGYVRVSSLDSAQAHYDELNAKEFVRASRFVGAEGTEGIWKIMDNPFYMIQP